MNIKTIKKKNGQTVYQASLYLGVDKITGKKVRTTITAKTKKGVKTKAQQKQADFERRGSTVYKEVKIKYYHELVSLWFETYKHSVKPNTIISTENKLKNHLLPIFGDLQLTKITPAMVQTVVNNWAAKARTKTTSNEQVKGITINFKVLHNYNKQILEHGVRLNLLESNPAKDVIVPKRPDLPSDKIFYLDKEKLKIFLDNLSEREDTYRNYYDATLYKFLLATGCRIGEALALDWDDIDFDKQTVSITKTLNGHREINTPKTKSSIRTIDIDNQTISLLKTYKRRQQQEAWLLGRSEHLVFSIFEDRYPNVQTHRNRLNRFTKRIGLGTISFHAFRHTHATLLLNAGVQYKQLQLRLGHSKISMTMDIYAHLSNESLKETANLFAQAIGNL